jgi:hypothetical protein
MQLTVESIYLERTTQCRFDFQCLECGEYPLCRPMLVIDDVTAVRAREANHCPYKVLFGDGQYCTCPTRTILCLKYGR